MTLSSTKRAPKTPEPEWTPFADADAIQFCKDHRLAGAVDDYLSAARRHFSLIGDPIIHTVSDEEIGGTSLMIVVRVAGAAETASDAYERFTRELVKTIGADVLGKVYLSYTIA